MWHTLLPQDFHNLKFLIIENTFAGETVIKFKHETCFLEFSELGLENVILNILKVMTNQF